MNLNNYCKIIVSLEGDGPADQKEQSCIRLEGPTSIGSLDIWRMIQSSNKGDAHTRIMTYIDLVHLRNAIDAVLVAYEGCLKQTT